MVDQRQSRCDAGRRTAGRRIGRRSRRPDMQQGVISRGRGSGGGVPSSWQLKRQAGHTRRLPDAYHRLMLRARACCRRKGKGRDWLLGHHRSGKSRRWRLIGPLERKPRDLNCRGIKAQAGGAAWAEGWMACRRAGLADPGGPGCARFHGFPRPAGHCEVQSCTIGREPRRHASWRRPRRRRLAGQEDGDLGDPWAWGQAAHGVAGQARCQGSGRC